MWKSRSVRFPRGGGSGGKPLSGFPRLPRPRHFHSAPVPAWSRLCSCPLGCPAVSQQRQLRLLHAARGLRVAPAQRFLFEQLLRDAWLQAFPPALQRSEFLVRRPVILGPVYAFASAALIDLDGGEAAGTVEVQIRVEVGRVELLERPGVLGADGAVADVLAHH